MATKKAKTISNSSKKGSNAPVAKVQTYGTGYVVVKPDSARYYNPKSLTVEKKIISA